MKDNVLAVLIVVQMLGLIGLGVVQQKDVKDTADLFTELVINFSEEIDNQKSHIIKMNAELTELKEQRSLERRLGDVEEQLRTYCLEGKLEMCGKLGPISK